MADFGVELYFDQVEQLLDEGLADGIGAALGHVLDVSNTRIPVDEGHARDSGDVDVDRSALEGAVSYGGSYPVQAYVERLHEDLTLNHPNGGQPKFLESAANSEADAIESILADRVKRVT